MMNRLPAPAIMKPLPPFVPRLSVPPLAKVVLPETNVVRVSVLAAPARITPPNVLLPMLTIEDPRTFVLPRPAKSMARLRVIPEVPPWTTSVPPGS